MNGDQKALQKIRENWNRLKESGKLNEIITWWLEKYKLSGHWTHQDLIDIEEVMDEPKGTYLS